VVTHRERQIEMGRLHTNNARFFIRLKYAPRKTGEVFCYRPSTISQVPGLKEGDPVRIVGLPAKGSKTVIVQHHHRYGPDEKHAVLWTDLCR
jgi:hypothetical protein